MTDRPLVMAITGASGAPYAVRLLESLIAANRSVQLIVSAHGLRLLRTESDIASMDALRERVGETGWDRCVQTFDDADRGAPPASGSALSAGMVICPCSMGTVAAIAMGTSRSLVERAADVALKERRKLILVPRETPLSAIHLENMLRVTRAGALVMPAKDSADLTRLVKGINDVTSAVLVIISLVTMAQVLVDVYRLLRPPSS